MSSMNEPKTYLRYTKITKIGVAKMLKEVENHLQWREEEHVLDVGCGPGDVTSQIFYPRLPCNSTVVAIDTSKDMIKYAEENYSHKCITYKQVDICGQELWKICDKEEFSKIFSFYCLHRIQQPKNAYENIYKLLKPGGYFTALYVIHDDLTIINEYLVKDPQYAEYINVFQKAILGDTFIDKVQELLISFGFEIIYKSISSYNISFQSMDRALEFVECISQFTQVLPQDIVKEILEKVRINKDLLGILPKVGKDYINKQQYFVIVARKM